MTLVVTGAGGCVGRAVLAAAAREGREVRGVVRPEGRRPEGDARIAVADVRDEAALVRAFEGASAVVHAAARMDGPEDEVRTSIVDGTRVALAAAREVGARSFVLLSTVSVYGEGRFVDADEDTPLRPDGAYAESKAEAEELARSAASDLAVTVLRPTSVFGPGDRSLAPYLIEVARHAVLPLFEGGAVRQDLTASADLARAAMSAAAGEEPGLAGPFHVHSGRLTLGELALRMREVLDLPARTVLVDGPEDVPPGLPDLLVRQAAAHRGFSIERVGAALDYRPTVRFPETVEPA